MENFARYRAIDCLRLIGFLKCFYFFFLLCHAVDTSEFGLDIEDYLTGE